MIGGERMLLSLNGRMMLALCLLCLFDAAATDVGLQLEYIKEANPLMRMLYETDRFLFYAVKAGMPLLLWWMCASFAGRRWFRISVFLCLSMYTAVGFFHIYWIGLVYLG